MPQESSEDSRRSPARFQSIGDIDGDEVRVAVIGTMVDKSESEVVVDDGAGKIEVEFDLSENLDDFEEGSKIRVIGRPQGNSIGGEALQDFSGFDLDLYEELTGKIKEIKGSF